MITLTHTDVRNRVSNNFVWTTDEGDITYVLHIRPIIGGTTANPYYRTISITSSDATVVGNTWTYSLTEDNLRHMYGTQVPYVWQIVGSSASSTGKFLWKPYITNLEWSINSYEETVYTRTIMLTGTYTGFIEKILVNNIEAELLTNAWRVQVELSPGVNQITVVAYDKWDCTSETKILKVTSYATVGINVNIETGFDRVGIFTGNIRKDSEDNYTFAKYVKQSQDRRGNATQQGLVFGLSTELRLPVYKAIVIDTKPTNPYGPREIEVMVDNNYIYYTTDLMIIEESFKLTDVLIRKLTKWPTFKEFKVLIDGKTTRNFDNEDDYVKFYPEDIGKICRISYSYCERVSKNQTLASIIDALNTTGDIDAYLADSVSSSSSGYGIIQTGWTDETTLLYSDVQIYPAGSPSTIGRFASTQATLLEYDFNHINTTATNDWPGSEMYGIAKELMYKRGYGWNNIVLGVSYWTLEHYTSHSLLPQILDAQYRRYGSMIPPVAELADVTTYSGVVLFKGGVVNGLEVTL